MSSKEIKLMELPSGKRILRYLRGTIKKDIHYKRVDDSSLIRYCDSDWGCSVGDYRNTSGYSFHIGLGAISWASKK